jgi:hypothetical protein
MKLVASVITLLLIALAVFAGYRYYSQHSTCPEIFRSVTVTTDDILARSKKATETMYPEIAARLITERWLDTFMQEDACPGQKLLDYDIDTIVLNEGTSLITATVSLSLDLPDRFLIGTDSEWDTEEGYYEDGWLKGKIMYLDILVEGDTYSLGSAYSKP